MSDTGNDTEQPKDGETEDALEEAEGEEVAPEYSPPISALPPRVVHQEEGQIEVSASPAFQCLDDVSYDSFFEKYLFLVFNILFLKSI